MLFEGFGLMVLNWLRIPPGASLRKADGRETKQGFEIANLDLVNSIVSITVDDICVGNSPVYISSDKKLPIHSRKKLEFCVKEFNSIVRWVATDLLKIGVSVYIADVTPEGNLLLLPYVKPLTFYLDKKKSLRVFDDENDELKDVVVFINYDKESLEDVEELQDDEHKNLLYKINPSPFQLKNIKQIGADLLQTERALFKYRKQISRLIRFLTVDIGVAQGATQAEVIDSISSAINADSSSLTYSGNLFDFDDSIPVLPNRRGVGKPEIVESTPSVDIKDLADLDYILNKLYLAMRFPKSYADFSNTLDQTAVSTIRSDIRYNKLVGSVRSLIVDTINEYLSTAKNLSKFGDLISLVELPTPEDEDVVAAMEAFTDFSEKVYGYVFSDTDSKIQAHLKLDVLKTLLGGVTSFKYLQDWFVLFDDYIDKHFDPDKDDVPPPSPGGSGSNREFTDISSDDLSDLEETPEQSDEGEIPEDFLDTVEEIEPQT